MKETHFRRVMRWRAADSPNVQLALIQQSKGLTPTGEVLVPGVISWQEYCHRRKHWDRVRQTEGLDAEWYKGPGALLFLTETLNRCEEVHRQILRREVEERHFRRQAKAMGVDSAQGGDNTSWVVGDDLGVMYWESRKTPDTKVIPGITKALIDRFGIPHSGVMLDAGGGGYQHACDLRADGYNVQVVAFGSSPTVDPDLVMPDDRQEAREARYAYRDMRAQMYGEAAILLTSQEGYGIPAEFTDLREQLAPMPLLRDRNGKMFMLPKDTPSDNPDAKGMTLRKLLGRSPDEADAFVLMVYGLQHAVEPIVVGGGW